jgi:glycosyltransferase involved in cell wall biosynthesis
MRILHLIPTLEGGGAERQLALLASEQARRGWAVHIGLRRYGVYREDLESAGVSLHALGDLRGFHPLLSIRMLQLIKRVQPEVIQTWLPQMDIVGGLVARLMRKPWILCERTSPEAHSHVSTVSFLRRLTARGAGAIAANSASGANYWRRLVPTGTNVIEITNAVDMNAVRRATPAKAWADRKARPLLLLVGRLLPVKAPDVFLKALALLPADQPAYAIVLGDGPLAVEIRTLISTNGLSDRVSVLPYQRDWWGYLKIATALVSTSRYEGQPNVVLEAMAAGCPLIVSDIPAHRAILDEHCAVFVPRDDPQALSRAIVSLLAAQGDARTRAERAATRAAAFSVHATTDEYQRVYSKVLLNRNSSCAES